MLSFSGSFQNRLAHGWLFQPLLLGFSYPTRTKLVNFSQSFSLVRGTFNFQVIEVTANSMPRTNLGHTFEDVREFRRSPSTPLQSATVVCKQWASILQIGEAC